MTEAPRTVWVTKYALTEGPREHKVLPGPYGRRYGNVRIEDPRQVCGWIVLTGIDWHPTREAALARAEEMRAAKIASLKRQIERLEALTF